MEYWGQVRISGTRAPPKLVLPRFILKTRLKDTCPHQIPLVLPQTHTYSIPTHLSPFAQAPYPSGIQTGLISRDKTSASSLHSFSHTNPLSFLRTASHSP